jgi:carboxypeptidase C (cathepsin A)
MLYIEQPAGVGFSVGNKSDDLSTNDLRSSQDGMTALNAFYAKFPSFRANSLFISGESYAGVYVPYLSWQVYQHNLMAKTKNQTD